MKTSRTSLITAAGIFAMTLFASSAQIANAGGLGLD